MAVLACGNLSGAALSCWSNCALTKEANVLALESCQVNNVGFEPFLEKKLLHMHNI